MEKLVLVALIVNAIVLALSFYKLGQYEMMQELCNENQVKIELKSK